MTRLRITLRRSVIGRPGDQKDTARALGLTRLNRTAIRPDNPAIRGMVTKLSHLVSVEEIENEAAAKPPLASARHGASGGEAPALADKE